MKSFVALLVGLAVGLGFAASGVAGGHAAASPLAVVATTTQLVDLVRNVGGSRVQVVGLLRPNVDPHTYEPTPSDAGALSRAGLVVVSGVGLDSWIGKVITASGTHARVVVASQGLPLRHGSAGEPQGDPHWWHDPTLFERAVRTVTAALQQADPPRRAVYAANERRYVAAIAAVDRANVALLATVPRAQRKLVTNHDAFGYLAAHYGITVVGAVMPSLSTAAEPNARQVAQLIARIASQHVKAIFTESSIDPKLEQQIAKDAHVRVYANLYGDSLGPPGSPGDTYLHMLRSNVEALVAGFLGQPTR